MGEIDDIMYRYLSNRERFADLFNEILFQGKNIIFPDQLLETTGKYTAVSHKSAKSSHKKRISGRSRDVKMLLQSRTGLYILAVENQTYADYSMPFRCMEYDALEYRRQLDELKSTHSDYSVSTPDQTLICSTQN